MNAVHPTMVLRRRSPEGQPYDLQSCDAFIECVRASGASMLQAAASLLDAQRSGKDFRTLGMSVLEAARRAGRKELMVDLVSMVPGYRLTGEFPREGLVWIVAAALIACEGDEDAMEWMDAFVSLDREGYSLEWLAKRCAAAHASDWPSVLLAADSLISERLRKAS